MYDLFIRLISAGLLQQEKPVSKHSRGKLNAHENRIAARRPMAHSARFMATYRQAMRARS